MRGKRGRCVIVVEIMELSIVWMETGPGTLLRSFKCRVLEDFGNVVPGG